jgi:hypothetical protein
MLKQICASPTAVLWAGQAQASFSITSIFYVYLATAWFQICQQDKGDVCNNKESPMCDGPICCPKSPAHRSSFPMLHIAAGQIIKQPKN